MSKSKSKKGRKRGKNKNKSTSATQESKKRRQHARGIRILQARKERGGGVAPRRNNRITESATKESREAKVKAKKAIQESNGKLQDERANERKRNNGWDTGERQKGEGTKKTKKKRRKKKEGKIKGKRQGCPGGTMLITWASTGGSRRSAQQTDAWVWPSSS